ncbi:RNA polymerase sigma factor [Actinoplanes couchii]|nr:hypothetical protein [Actinoplanes couchii]MDR6316053.1 DNA-directed RNA polymerase specialized sigma24 family protein [Actinoplanes couchii]
MEKGTALLGSGHGGENFLEKAVPFSLPGAGAGPLFDWFLDRFAQLTWNIPAEAFGPGLPPREMRPRGLERFLLEDADYPQRDRIWAAVIAGSRRPGADEAYRILALGLATRGLRGFRDRLAIRDRSDLADIDHDLVAGFLRRLATIDTGTTNLGMKLIDSGITHAKVRLRQSRLRPPTINSVSLPYDDPYALLVGLAAESALAPLDVQLLSLTAVDGLSIKDAAKHLGIGEQAAYKRRQRAEARIRRHLTGRGARA